MTKLKINSLKNFLGIHNLLLKEYWEIKMHINKTDEDIIRDRARKDILKFMNQSLWIKIKRERRRRILMEWNESNMNDKKSKYTFTAIACIVHFTFLLLYFS